VVAADVVQLDAVVVEIVQDAQAELVALAVVRLRNATAVTKQTNWVSLSNLHLLK
jgi:hypothetical protein